MPIQAQAALAFLQGEINGFDAITSGMVPTTASPSEEHVERKSHLPQPKTWRIFQVARGLS